MTNDRCSLVMGFQVVRVLNSIMAIGISEETTPLSNKHLIEFVPIGLT